jgi:uncharacterized membrane protein YbhN (UPF0104 family)
LQSLKASTKASYTEIIVNIVRLLRKFVPFLLLLGATGYLLRLIPVFHLEFTSSPPVGTWCALLGTFALVQILAVSSYTLILPLLHPLRSFRPLVSVLFASHSLNYLGPMKIGMPIRVFLLKRVMGVPYSAGSVAVMVATGLDLSVLIALTLVLWSWLYLGPSAGLLAGSLSLALFVGVLAGAQRLGAVLPAKPEWLRTLLGDVAKLSRLATTGALLLSVSRALFNAWGSWLLLVGLGATIGLPEFTLAYFLSLLAGFLSFLPMGLGVRDASLVELLSRVGVPAPLGLTFVAVDRLIWSLLPLVIGIAAGWYLGIGGLMRSFKNETAG